MRADRQGRGLPYPWSVWGVIGIFLVVMWWLEAFGGYGYGARRRELNRREVVSLEFDGFSEGLSVCLY